MNYDYHIVNADTDSISFRKKDGSEFTEEEQKSLISEINAILPKMIEYEHDGYYDPIIVIKAKNYVLKDKKTGKVKLKGSSLRDSKKEPALKKFLGECIDDLITTDGKYIVDIYHKYIKEAYCIKDISRWCTKKSVTKATFASTRSNEEKILEAIRHKNPREGDKYLLYSAIDGQVPDIENITSNAYTPLDKNLKPKMIDNEILKLVEDWTGDENKLHYVKRVYATLDILKNVIDMDQIIKYHNKGNFKKLEALCQSDQT